jgi:hypothetical protein
MVYRCSDVYIENYQIILIGKVGGGGWGGGSGAWPKTSFNKKKIAVENAVCRQVMT